MMSAKLLKLHVVLMESINSMLGNLSRNSRNISLELLSARVCVRKRLGFLREQALALQTPGDEKQKKSEAEPSSSITRTGTGTCTRGSKLIQPHTTIISGLSMKQVRPFALQSMSEVQHFFADAAQVTQNMYRFATPSPLMQISHNDFQCLNYSDRPFALLDNNEKRLFTIAQRFHRQWFQYNKEHFTGKASIVCFVLASKCSPLFDPRDAFRIYYVGEIFHSQVT